MNDDITVTAESEDEDVPESSFIQSVVDHARKALDCASAQINVQIVDSTTIRNLNKQYRGKDKSTNVLSFPCDLPDWIESDLVGDIVLCPAVIRREAGMFNKSIDSRWAHMLIHGTLHLLGMTHDEVEQQTTMEQMEQKVMGELGYEDPYQVTVL